MVAMFSFKYLRDVFGIPPKMKVSWCLIERQDSSVDLGLMLHGSKVFLDIAKRRFFACQNAKICKARRMAADKQTYYFVGTNSEGKILSRLFFHTYLSDLMYATRYSAELEKNPPL